MDPTDPGYTQALQKVKELVKEGWSPKKIFDSGKTDFTRTQLNGLVHRAKKDLLQEQSEPNPREQRAMSVGVRGALGADQKMNQRPTPGLAPITALPPIEEAQPLAEPAPARRETPYDEELDYDTHLLICLLRGKIKLPPERRPFNLLTSKKRQEVRKALQERAASLA
jgi:hypothetical protein